MTTYIYDINDINDVWEDRGKCNIFRPILQKFVIYNLSFVSFISFMDTIRRLKNFLPLSLSISFISFISFMEAT